MLMGRLMEQQKGIRRLVRVYDFSSGYSKRTSHLNFCFVLFFIFIVFEPLIDTKKDKTMNVRADKALSHIRK